MQAVRYYKDTFWQVYGKNGGDLLGNVFVMREKFLERAKLENEEMKNL